MGWQPEYILEKHMYNGYKVQKKGWIFSRHVCTSFGGKKTAARFTSRGKNQHTNQKVPLALSTCEQREEPIHQLICSNQE